MASDWHTVALTSRCRPTTEPGQILLPEGSTLPGTTRVLIEKDSQAKLMKPDLRGDPGEAACVPAATLQTFGGDGTEVRYGEIGFLGVLKRDSGLRLQCGISLLTLVATALAAWGAYVKNAGDGPGSWARESAVWILVIALILAVLKFYKDYQDI